MTFRQEIWKVVIEKGFLALIIAAVGFALDYELKRFEGRVDYQSSLFDLRRQAYQTLVLKAQIARDRVLSLHVNRERPLGEVKADSEWERTFVRLRGAAHYLASGSTGGGWGDPWSLDKILDAVGALEDVNRVRNDNALFISTGADASIDAFLESLSKDVEAVMASIKSEAKPDANLHAHARSQVIAAYQNLLKAIRESLRIEDIILG
jgi:hypothetical protein